MEAIIEKIYATNNRRKVFIVAIAMTRAEIWLISNELFGFLKCRTKETMRTRITLTITIEVTWCLIVVS